MLKYANVCRQHSQLFEYLTKKFQEDFAETLLANSTEWKSVARYPNHLKGKALFTLTPSDTYKVPKTFPDKILSLIGLGKFDTTQNVLFTDEVKDELTKG